MMGHSPFLSPLVNFYFDDVIAKQQDFNHRQHDLILPTYVRKIFPYLQLFDKFRLLLSFIRTMIKEKRLGYKFH